MIEVNRENAALRLGIKDLPNLEFHLLDTGHFALEEDGAVITELIREFLRKSSSQMSAAD